MPKQIIISILVIVLVQGLTNLTTSNCPSNFDPSTYNSSLSLTNKDLAVSLYSSVLSAQLKANITDSLGSGQLYSVMNSFTSTSFLLPYILICSFFGLLFLTTVCCCIFQRRCPPCKSWRRNYVKDPYTRCQRGLTMAFGVLFSSGILITTIIVFSSFKMLRTDLEMIKCSMYYNIDVATNGLQERNWGGFGQVQSQLSSISDLIATTATEANNTLSNNDWIITGFESLQKMNLQLWEDNKNSVVLTPDPIATFNANNNSLPIPTIVTRFIAEGLGPNGTANTMITDISNGFQITKQITNQAQTTYTSAMLFASSASNITYNTNANLQSITGVTSLLNKIQVGLTTFSNNYIAYATNYGIYVMEAIFGLILLASMISLLGLLSTHIFDLLKCIKMVHGGWALYGFAYFAVVGVTFAILVIGGVSNSFCQYFGTVMNSSSSFASFSSQTDGSSLSKVSRYMDVCFFGDGNILKKFSVAEEMKTVSGLFENTQKYINMQTVGDLQYVDLTASTTKVLGWMNAMNQYALGVYQDADPTNLTQSNPYIALSNLNLLTLRYNTTSPDSICSNDLWVFDAANCSNSSSEALYSPSADNTNGLYFPPTGTLCISFNSRLSTAAPSIWTSSDIAQRYLSLRSCNLNSSSNAYTKILQYAQSLTNYRDTRKNLYRGIYDQLNSLLLENSAYNANMTTFTANLNTFYSSVATLNNLVTNQINGLTISANCTAIADTFRFFYNMYCVNFFNRSVKIVVCCFILLVLMIGGLIAGSIFGVRYQRVEKERRLTKVQVQSEVIDQQESNFSEDSARSNNSEENN